MADQIIQYTEEMVGTGHPTKDDTLNRALLIEHNADGTHKPTDVTLGSIFDVEHTLSTGAHDPAFVTMTSIFEVEHTASTGAHDPAFVTMTSIFEVEHTASTGVHDFTKVTDATVFDAEHTLSTGVHDPALVTVTIFEVEHTASTGVHDFTKVTDATVFETGHDAAITNSSIVKVTDLGGSATAQINNLATYSGSTVKPYRVEIDGVGGGKEIGQATFAWYDGTSWTNTVTTSASYLTLNNGMEIKWTAGTGDDFEVGDGWMFELGPGLHDLTLVTDTKVFRLQHDLATGEHDGDYVVLPAIIDAEHSLAGAHDPAFVTMTSIFEVEHTASTGAHDPAFVTMTSIFEVEHTASTGVHDFTKVTDATIFDAEHTLSTGVHDFTKVTDATVFDAEHTLSTGVHDFTKVTDATVFETGHDAAITNSSIVKMTDLGGSATAQINNLATYSGSTVKPYRVEIDGVGGGKEIGQATFAWYDGTSWTNTVTTSASYLTLNNGMEIKWTAGTGDDFEVGDGWMFELGPGLHDLTLVTDTKVFRLQHDLATGEHDGDYVVLPAIIDAEHSLAGAHDPAFVTMTSIFEVEHTASTGVHDFTKVTDATIFDAEHTLSTGVHDFTKVTDATVFETGHDAAITNSAIVKTSDLGGSATAQINNLATYSGSTVKPYRVEIDGVGGGKEIGQATFAWYDGTSWTNTVTTSASYLTLNNGMQIKWTAGTGDDFEVGDGWMFELGPGLHDLTLVTDTKVFRFQHDPVTGEHSVNSLVTAAIFEVEHTASTGAHDPAFVTMTSIFEVEHTASTGVHDFTKVTDATVFETGHDAAITNSAIVKTSDLGGSATAQINNLASYSGSTVKPYRVEIDGVGGGKEIGQATFAWHDGTSWTNTVTTSASYLTLNNGMEIKWTAGTGDDFEVGDHWKFELGPGLHDYDFVTDLKVFRFQHDPVTGEHEGGGTAIKRSIDDDSVINLETSKAGWGYVAINDDTEHISFRFNAAAEVTFIENSANTINSDTDGNLCVYDGGTNVVIKNRLGSTYNIAYSVDYIT